jgi:hypothetical protein
LKFMLYTAAGLLARKVNCPALPAAEICDMLSARMHHYPTSMSR